MKQLRHRYYKVIESLEPYENIREHYRLSCDQMLYNLVEIARGWEFEANSPDYINITQLITDFKSKGYRPSLY